LAVWRAQGKANLKERIAKRAEIDPASLPYNEEFLDFLGAAHAAGRKIWLATASHRKLAEQVVAQVATQLPEAGPARAALKSHGGVIVTKTAAEAVALANTAAPEHLVVDDERMAKQVRCTGSLFVGAWTAQVAGDYAIGSNHVLPTAGAARVRGGLSAADFVRQITVQRLTAAGLRRIGPTVIDLATAEGLSAHAASVAIRMKGTRS